METNNKEIKRRSTFSLLFYINRTKVRKDGTCKLLCKVSIDAKSAPININAFVDPSLWNPETKRANGRSENARTVNLAIEKLTEKITGHYRHIRKSLGFVTAELVKNAVEGIGQKPFTLLALFREHNEEFRKRVGVDRKEETYESYENSYNILASFVKKRKEKEDVALRSLDREFYDDFEIFLRTDREMKPKTVHEHLYRLKKMTKRAVSQGTLRRDPYGKLHPELPRRKSRHLKLEDLKKLMETPVGKPNLQRVRDYILQRWPEDYEVIFSNRYLLELTDKGSDKGQMVARVAELLDIFPEKVYCIGDNQNDIPMLARSAIPFAPANCAPQVKEWGAHILGHCDEHAVAQAIALLDSIY